MIPIIFNIPLRLCDWKQEVQWVSYFIVEGLTLHTFKCQSPAAVAGEGD